MAKNQPWQGDVRRGQTPKLNNYGGLLAGQTLEARWTAIGQTALDIFMNDASPTFTVLF